MKEEMDIILSATDNASSTFEAVEHTARDLGDTLENIGDEGSEGMDELGEGADKSDKELTELKQTLDDLLEKKKQMQEEGTWGFNVESSKLSGEIADVKRQLGEIDDEPITPKFDASSIQLGIQNITDGIMRAKEGVAELGRNLVGALSLAGQQQQQETFLTMSIGAEKAAKQMKIINELVADLPGDDVAIGGLLSQAAAKNAGITADELGRMGTNAADYFAAMGNYGKSSVEAQQDLVNYILAGNTAELERSPVLQGHIDKLKAATTIEERNKALQEALTEEGWAGISQQDTYNNKLETFTAMLDRGKRQMGEMFMGAASGAMDFIGMLDQATGGVLSMGIALAGVTAGPMIDIVTGVGQMATGLKAIKDAGAVTALAEMLPFIVADEEAFLGLALAENISLGPILAIVAAIALLGVAIYEIGKYFGWWTDVSSMLNAIWAGIQRLWSAFIHHPDVQSIIKVLTQAWNMLSKAISGVITWISSFFKANTGGKFDVVRALINGISWAWNALTLPIRLVITLIKAFISVGQAVASGQINILQSVMNVWNSLTAFFSQILSQIIGKIVSWGQQVFNNAVQAAVRFVTGIMSNIRSLPSKFLRILILVLKHIITRANQWVAQAKSGALRLITGVMNYWRQLPGKALSALLGVVHSIVSAGNQWVSNAKDKAKAVVEGAYNTLKNLPNKVGSALKGVVKAITKPFQDAYNKAKKIWDDITHLGGLIPGGSAGFDYEGMLEEMMNNRQVPTIQGENSLDINIKHELDFNFSLDNVPEGADEETILSMIKQSMTDKAVVKALVTNPDFQSFDQKIKERIVLKNNRARGV